MSTEVEKVVESSLDVKQMNRILKLLVDSLEGGKEFVLEQAPVLAQDIVAFGRAYYTMVVVLSGLAVFVVMPLLSWVVLRYARKIDPGNSDTRVYFVPVVLCGVGVVVAGTVGLTNLCESIRPVLLAWFAPRLFILEYIGDILS